MSSDSFGWLVTTVFVLALMRPSKEVGVRATEMASPSAEREIDPTRWRHTGVQPLFIKNGNQAPIVDEEVSRLISAF